MLDLHSLRHHLGGTHIANLTNPARLAALGISLSVGYAAFKYITKDPSQEPSSMAPTGPQTIVIVGGGIAGIQLAHRLLKDLVPKVPGLRVVLVSQSTHLYWNFAAVRGVIPGELSDDQLFIPIQPPFEKYPQDKFEFVLGTATSLDLDGNSVLVETGSGTRTVGYNHLVIATGSKLAAEQCPFKLLDSYEETLTAWHGLQQQVDKASSIVIAGAGTTGVETAGELGCKYGTQKQITLVIDGPRALPTLPASASKQAEMDLKAMGVQLIHNTRVEEVADARVKLTNGTVLTTDLYLPLYGVRANTKFVPPHLLDERGNINTQPTLRVRGLNNVWAVGDVNDVENKQATKAGAQANHAYNNIQAVLTGNPAAVTDYKPSSTPMLFVTIGKKRGTGVMGSFKPWSFLVTYAKGRTLFIEKAKGVAAGKGL
jgi:NADH dehydrogenase FAD-containing subunit